MTVATKPGWIQTFTGRRFWPLDPNPEDIDIQDVAHALANLCRYTGHSRFFYSVAQHSVLVSLRCDPKDALWGLLHDASEAYLNDIARPVKHAPEFGFYRRAEMVLMAAVVERFHLPYLQPESVTIADNKMLYTERRDLMPTMHDPTWGAGTTEVEPYPAPIHSMLPWEAENWFLDRFGELAPSEVW